MPNRKDLLLVGSALAAALALGACSSGIRQSPSPEAESPALSTQADTAAWQRIAVATDDAEETLSTGAVALDSIDLDLGTNAQGGTAVGIRFTNLAIPKGAVIKSANLYFLPAVNSAGAATLTIQAHSSYISNTFAATSKNITSRYLTPESVNWTVPTWTQAMTLQSPEVKSPDLKSLVQPLVNGGAVDALTFAIRGTGSRIAESFEGTSGKKPALEVVFTPPTPIVVSCLSASTNRLNWTNQTYSDKSLEGQPAGTGVDAKGSRFSGTAALRVVKNPAGAICLSGGFYAPNLADGDNSVWDCDFLAATEAEKAKCRADGEFHGRDGIVIGVSNSGNLAAGGSKSTTVENVAVGTTGDAFAVKRDTSGWAVRNAYVRHAGDDAIEADFFNAGVVDNVLVDWAYTGFSCRKGTTAQEANVPFVIKNSLLALRPQHGNAQESNVDPTKGTPGHYYLFKWNQDQKDDTGKIVYYARKGCQVTLQDNVFLLTKNGGHIDTEKNGNTTYASSWEAFDEAGCRNNLVIYLGSDQNYIDMLRSEAAALPAGCFTVQYPTSTVSRQSLIDLWRQKRAAWFDRNPQFGAYRNAEPVAPGF